MSRTLAVAVALAFGVTVVATTAQARPQAAQGMYAIQIVNYKVNPSRTVTVNVKIRGLKMAGMSKQNAAGKGHWNIYVNGKLSNYSVSPTSGMTKVLKKGDYKVYATLVDNDGSPLSEPTRSKTIPVMVGA